MTEKVNPITGKGVIHLETHKEGEEFVTYCRKEFDNLNTEGTIKELKKIIKELQKDL